MNTLILKILLLTFNFNQPPTHLELYNELVVQEVLFPEIVVRQAITETNCGKTGVGATKNNIFGITGKGGYVKYDTWQLSVTGYKTWQDKNYTSYKNITGKTDYYDFLWWVGYKDGKKYSEKGRGYIAYLKKIKPNI